MEAKSEQVDLGILEDEVDKQGQFEDIKDNNCCCLNTRNRAIKELKCKISFTFFSPMNLLGLS